LVYFFNPYTLKRPSDPLSPLQLTLKCTMYLFRLAHQLKPGRGGAVRSRSFPLTRSPCALFVTHTHTHTHTLALWSRSSMLPLVILLTLVVVSAPRASCVTSCDEHRRRPRLLFIGVRPLLATQKKTFVDSKRLRRSPPPLSQTHTHTHINTRTHNAKEKVSTALHLRNESLCFAYVQAK